MIRQAIRGLPQTKKTNLIKRRRLLSTSPPNPPTPNHETPTPPSQGSFYHRIKSLWDNLNRQSHGTNLSQIPKKEIKKSFGGYDEKSVEAQQHYNLAEEYFKKDNFEAAMIYFDKVHQIMDGNDKLSLLVWCKKATCLENLKKYEEALECYDKANRFGGFYPAWIDKGLCYREMNRNEEEIGCYDSAIAMNDENGLVWFLKGNCLKGMNRYEEALECLEKSIEIEEKETNLFSKGEVLFLMGRYEEAIECWKKTIEINPNNSMAWFYLGGANMNLYQYENTILCFGKFLELDDVEKRHQDTHVLVLNSIAECYQNLGNYKEELKCLTKSISLSKDGDVLCKKGYCLRNLGMYQEALECFQETIKIDEKNSQAYIGIGISMVDLHLSDKSIKYFNKAIELSPDDDNPWYNKGVALRTIKNHRGAIECLEKAIQIHPDVTSNWILLAEIYRDLENYQEAQNCYTTVLETDKENKEAWDGKIGCFLEMGYYEDAIDCCKKRMKKGDKHNNADYLVVMAVLYGLMGRHDDALESVNRSYQMNPAERTNMTKAFILDLKGDTKNAQIYWDKCSSDKTNWIKAMKSVWKKECGPVFTQLMSEI